MSISYHVRTKVPQKNYIWEISGGDRKDLENNMQSVRNRTDRSAGMSGSYPYAGMYTTEDECIQIHGNTQREKQSDDLRPIRPTEIQIWEQTFLGKRILCGHGREKQDCNSKVHTEPAGRR